MKKYKISSDTNPSLGVVEVDSIEAALDLAADKLGGSIMSDRVHNDGFAVAELWIGGKTVSIIVTLTS